MYNDPLTKNKEAARGKRPLHRRAASAPAGLERLRPCCGGGCGWVLGNELTFTNQAEARGGGYCCLAG